MQPSESMHPRVEPEPAVAGFTMQATDLPFNVAIEAPFWELFQPPYAIGSEAWQAAQVCRLSPDVRSCALSGASAVAC